ncbi:hypothetical protein CQA49_08975 [Helicobacter sp. MIT 00-7814]|uniref:hypothetical protein n=1 Tax=unclassified Helicobacter TaxID=2593540 RepID=UPI000E1E3169|nr:MULTISPECIES: hypothetical protein [unclassified Helicobacter]RDU51961.1 hypothetical protein CQA49_08975 [Helicobacter sp. MIT 00-7814]RDU54131.1 hypothetical protein CQA37_05830 [Helicobacter sp. MIT 99-10781]
MANNTNNGVKRVYGVERNFGDILWNKENNSVFVNIDAGFFRATVSLAKNNQGGYDLLKSYTNKDGQNATFIGGKTFPVKNKEGVEVEGLTRGLLGLFKEYDAEQKKEFTRNNDALEIVTHKLKEHKKLGDSNIWKVGYLTGRIAIEEANTQASSNAASDFAPMQEQDTHTFEISDEDIPF